MQIGWIVSCEQASGVAHESLLSLRSSDVQLCTFAEAKMVSIICQTGPCNRYSPDSIHGLLCILGMSFFIALLAGSTHAAMLESSYTRF
jgi:hypothetical protein